MGVASESATGDLSITAPAQRTSDAGISDAVLWALLDAAPDGLLVVDEQGLMQLANRRVEELFGYRRGDLFGHPIEILLPERAREQHQQHRQAYTAQPRTRSMGDGGDLLGRRRDGSEFPVDISLSPLATDARRWVIAAVRDGTHRRASEHRQRQIAVINEEDRMARELGESVIRGLFGTGLRLQALRARVAGDIQGEVDAIVTDIDDSIREIRTAIFGLSDHESSAG